MGDKSIQFGESLLIVISSVLYYILLIAVVQPDISSDSHLGISIGHIISYIFPPKGNYMHFHLFINLSVLHYWQHLKSI